MGEQVRSIEAEQRYNKRWLMGLLGAMVLVAILSAAWMFTVAGQLPEELATHWNGKNEVDGWSSLWGFAITSALTTAGCGGLIAVLAVLMRGQNSLLARVGAGLGVGFGVGMAALMVATVAGQIGLTDTSQATMSGPVMGAGLAVAAILGVLVMWLYRPGEMDRTQSPEVRAANEVATAENSNVVAAANTRAARGETLRIKVSMGAWAWLLSVGVGGVVMLSTYFIFPFLSLLGVVVGAIIWVFCRGTVVIGPEGIKVLASDFWKVMPLAWKEVRTASVQDIKAMDYGGWGYRMNGGAIGYIMGSGPAVVVKAGFHQEFVFSMPDADTGAEAAALMNAYAHSTTVKH